LRALIIDARKEAGTASSSDSSTLRDKLEPVRTTTPPLISNVLEKDGLRRQLILSRGRFF